MGCVQTKSSNKRQIQSIKIHNQKQNNSDTSTHEDEPVTFRTPHSSNQKLEIENIVPITDPKRIRKRSQASKYNQIFTEIFHEDNEKNIKKNTNTNTNNKKNRFSKNIDEYSSFKKNSQRPLQCISKSSLMENRIKKLNLEVEMLNDGLKTPTTMGSSRQFSMLTSRNLQGLDRSNFQQTNTNEQKQKQQQKKTIEEYMKNDKYKNCFFQV